LEDREIGRLEDWKIERLEDWKIERLKDREIESAGNYREGDGYILLNKVMI
jgi:hypothetical protein